MKQTKVSPIFVEKIPAFKDFKDCTLYISIPYKVAIHKCMCGCGSEVVTPLSPTGWNLAYNGESVSLSPSIGNWNYPCKSHYFIRGNRVIWLRSEQAYTLQENTNSRKRSKWREWFM